MHQAYRVTDQVLWRRMGERTVLVHLGTRRVYSLNDTGSRIWELLAEGLAPDELRHRLLGEFEADERVLAADLERALVALERRGLVAPGRR